MLIFSERCVFRYECPPDSRNCCPVIPVINLVITVVDPESVDDFISHTKRESAHAIHSSERSLRVEFISFFKRQCEVAAYIYKTAKHGLTELLLPPGMFTLGGTLNANLWFPPA